MKDGYREITLDEANQLKSVRLVLPNAAETAVKYDKSFA